MADAPKRVSLQLGGLYGCLVEYVLAADYDALAAELEKSVNNARGLWIDSEQQARRIAALEAALREIRDATVEDGGGYWASQVAAAALNSSTSETEAQHHESPHR